MIVLFLFIVAAAAAIGYYFITQRTTAQLDVNAVPIIPSAVLTSSQLVLIKELKTEGYKILNDKESIGVTNSKLPDDFSSKANKLRNKLNSILITKRENEKDKVILDISTARSPELVREFGTLDLKHLEESTKPSNDVFTAISPKEYEIEQIMKPTSDVKTANSPLSTDIEKSMKPTADVDIARSPTSNEIQLKPIVNILTKSETITELSPEIITESSTNTDVLISTIESGTEKVSQDPATLMAQEKKKKDKKKEKNKAKKKAKKEKEKKDANEINEKEKTKKP